MRGSHESGFKPQIAEYEKCERNAQYPCAQVLTRGIAVSSAAKSRSEETYTENVAHKKLRLQPHPASAESRWRFWILSLRRHFCFRPIIRRRACGTLGHPSHRHLWKTARGIYTIHDGQSLEPKVRSVDRERSSQPEQSSHSDDLWRGGTPLSRSTPDPSPPNIHPTKIRTNASTIWNTQGAPHKAMSFVWVGVKARWASRLCGRVLRRESTTRPGLDPLRSR